jgi:hypothetical protein
METLANTSPIPHIFPLPVEILATNTDIMGEFGDEELQAIQENNLALLSADDPIRYLLELRARPLLAQGIEGPEIDAYKAGVCVGAVMVRHRVREIKKEFGELAVPPLLMSSEYQPVYERKFSRLLRMLPPAVELTIEELIDHQDIYLRPASYLDSIESIASVGRLKAQWMNKRLPFMGVHNIEAGVDDYKSLGIGDALALHARIYSEKPTKHEDNLKYNPTKHFLRAVERQKVRKPSGGDPSGLTRSTLDIKPGDVIEMLQGPNTKQVSFRSVDAYAGESHDKRDTWWTNRVYPGRRITHLRTFETGHAMPRPGHDDQVLEVGYRNTINEWELGPQDVLLIKGPGGKLMQLDYPFNVDWNHIVSWEEEHRSTELLAVCRNGKLTELVGLEDYTDDIKQISSPILEFQKDRLFGRVGQTIVRRAGQKRFLTETAALLALTTGTTYIVEPDTSEYSFYPDALVSLPVTLVVGGLAVYGLSKWRKRLAKPPKVVNEEEYID